MVLEFFRSPRKSTLDDVEATLVQMLRDGRSVYDTASAAVFGGGKSKAAKREVRSTDREINAAQSEVRRSLVLHATTHGAIDMPLVLAYMSVVKDVERVGDYAKNLYDIAKYGADFSEAYDLPELEQLRDAVGNLIDDTAETFADQDAERAAALINKADGFLSDYDARIRREYHSDGPASNAVARALYFRYLKRITAHLMNLLTSMTRPIDQLDHYDEAPEDRDAGGPSGEPGSDSGNTPTDSP